MPTTSYTDELPPLNSDCRWRCIDKLILQLLEYSCSGHDVVLDLHEALCAGRLHCQLRIGRERKQLTAEDWTNTFDLVWWDDADGNWRVDIVIRESGAYLMANIYLWKPEFDALWPCESNGLMPIPVTEPVKTEAPQPKRVTTPAERRSNLRHPDWPKILKRWDPVVNTRGRWLNAHAAKSEILEKQSNLTISSDALYKGILNFLPEWYGLEPKE